MGWENRKNGRYYYTKERIGSRVVSRYVGNGETAELISKFSSLRRDEDWERREVIAAEFEAMEAEDRMTDEIFEMAADLMKSALMAEGFHQHKRGEWRRARNAKSKSKDGSGND